MKSLTRVLFRVGLALGAAAVASNIVDASTAAQRWQQSAGAAQQRFTEGVQQTQKDPTALAIAQQPKMLNNFQQAITSGRFARNLARVGKAGWQSATVAKANNYSTGINASVEKFAAAIAPVLAFESQLQSRVDSMPKATLQDSIARMTVWATELHNWAASR